MIEKIPNIIQNALEELNNQLDQPLIYDKNLKLMGKNAAVDSMTFVTFITIIEELIEDELDEDIQIVSDKTFSRENSPFQTIAALEEFIAELIQD